MRYHYTFSTYERRPLLEDKEIRKELNDLFRAIAEEKDFKIIECEILADHVHLLIEQSYILSTSMAMKLLKGISSRRLFQKYPTNRFDIRKLWERSFRARKIKNEEKDVIINYIKNQRDENGFDKRFQVKREFILAK